MKSTFARRMSILLVLAMVLAMLPVAALAADTTTTVYFQNDWNWSDIRVHYWGAETTEWPGNPMVDTGKTNDAGNKIYSFEVPAGCTGILFTGIDNGSLKQSNDITDFNSDVIYYMSWNEQAGEHVESYDAKYVFGGEDTEPVVTEPVVTEPVVTEPVETITVYVDAVTENLSGTIYAYAWNAAGPVIGAWPGSAMTNVKGNVYSFEVPTNATNIIFNNNSLQSDDLDMPTATGMIWNGTEFVDYATYTPSGEEVKVFDYYVAGTMNGWANPDPDFGMTDADGDGVYTYTFAAVAGDYSLKVTNGTWADGGNWGGTGAGGNYDFVVATDCDVTVSFDSNTYTVTVTGSGIEGVTYPAYVVVGNVLGLDDAANWAVSNGAVMVDNGDGTYSYTFKALAVSPDAETPYEFKVVKDGTTWIPEGGNWKFFVINEASDVVITINTESSEISINLGDNVVFDYPGTEPVITPMPEIDKVVVAGGAAEEGADQGGFLYGQNWIADSMMNGLFADEDSKIYSTIYTNVAAGSYAFKFAINGNWDINFASGVEVVSGEEVVAYFAAQGNSILNITEDGATVEFILDLTDTVNVGDNAKMIVNITYPEKVESKAPESMVIGENEFSTGAGDYNYITSTFTATESGTLMFDITYLSMVDAFSGEWSECPPMFIGMQGRGYGLMVNGENFWPNGSIEVVAGETYEIGVASFMGTSSKMVVTLSMASCDHKYVYSYGWDDNTHNFVCSECGDSFSEVSSDYMDLGVWTSAPVLSDSIAVQFSIAVPAGFSNAYVVFELNGEETVVFDSVAGEAYGYPVSIFTFPGLNPQKLGDNICTTIYATYNGYEVSVCSPNYNLRDDYCLVMLPIVDANFKTLISDLMVYAAKTQIVQNYRTDALVTDGVEGLTPSTFEPLGPEYNKENYVGEYFANAMFMSGSLKLSGKMTVAIYVYVDDISKYTFTAEVNGRVTTYGPEDLEPAEYGMYVLYFDDLKASAFDEVITFSILENGDVVGEQMEYSVNSYIYTAQNLLDGDMKELLMAIYNYGEAARAVTGG